MLQVVLEKNINAQMEKKIFFNEQIMPRNKCSVNVKKVYLLWKRNENETL